MFAKVIFFFAILPEFAQIFTQKMELLGKFDTQGNAKKCKANKSFRSKVFKFDWKPKS